MGKKDELVCKSNSLVEASYRLSLVEQQIILFSIARGREEDVLLDPSTPVTISASDFAEMFGVNPKLVYAQLKEAMDVLYERSVLIHEIDRKTQKEKVTKSRWISTASYINGAGQIQIIFAPKVIPFLTRPTREFTRYEIEQVSEMSSIYAIRLYELLKQYQRIGKRQIRVDELRQMFAMEEGEYPRMFDFKKRVIDVAVTQINAYTNIRVSYGNVKEGRSVVGFIFKIERAGQEEKARKTRQPALTNAYIEQHKLALPGESHDQTRARVRVERAKKQGG